MEISRQNYEQYFIDYLDGKLDEKQVEVLMSFLEFNPDLKEEFADIEKMCLAPDDLEFSGKPNLLKSETDLLEAAILKDFDMYCISSMENDISGEEEEILQGILEEDSDRQDTYMLYQSTRLLPDESILYQGKARLKKRYIPVFYRIALPAAAAVVAFLIVFQIFRGNGMEVYQADQINQSSETSGEHPEMLSLPEEPGRSKEKRPPITTQESSTEISPEKDLSTTQKGFQLAETSMTDTEVEIRREIIQLDRMASKPVPPLVHSHHKSREMPSASLAIRQSSRLPDNRNASEISADNPRLSLWILADASVRGLNSVSEDEFHLDRKKDKNGKTRRITFDTPVFGISAPLRKPDKGQ